MEKLTEFVSKQFDPSRSALSVHYLAQSAARPDTPEHETSPDHRVTLPPPLPLGLPLDIPRYPLLPVTSTGLPYPLPLLLAQRSGHQSPPSLLLPQPHMLSQSPPRLGSPPSPKRRRRHSSSSDHHGSPHPDDTHEEEEEVDVEAPPEEPHNLSLHPGNISSIAEVGSLMPDSIMVKNEPSGDVGTLGSLSGNKETINNNNINNNNNNKDIIRGDRFSEDIAASQRTEENIYKNSPPPPLTPGMQAECTGGFISINNCL